MFRYCSICNSKITAQRPFYVISVQHFVPHPKIHPTVFAYRSGNSSGRGDSTTPLSPARSHRVVARVPPIVFQRQYSLIQFGIEIKKRLLL